MPRFWGLLLAVIVLSNRSHSNPITGRANFELIILHNNDMHARFDQTNALSNECHEQEAKCYGGFARVAHIVRKYRTEEPNVLFLNAGDTYTGTPWFSLYKDEITSELMNILKPDAISLGNHEFDHGVAGLVPFLNTVTFPVLAANLDLSKTPEMTNIPALIPSTIFTKAGKRIGVIGYLTPDTKSLVSAMTVEFFDEIEAINREAERLQRDENVDIIIALGHSGIVRDQEIAKNCPLVDIIIGGHSHTFLYSGDSLPDRESPYGPYPVVVTQSSGKKVPVVQSYAFTKYLGYLKLEFSDNGDLLSWDGQPLLLNATVTQDADVLAAIDKYRAGVEDYGRTIVGQSKVILVGDTCRLRECNFGNVITDAYVYMKSLQYTPGADNHWTDAAIGLVQGGGIRSSIDAVTNGNGTVIRSELDTVLPFQNDLVVTQVTGAVLKKALEHSVSNYNKDTGNPEFLQVSGIHVRYDLNRNPNNRIVFLEVLCADCDIPVYEQVDDNKNYNIIVSTFMKNGGDGFSMLTDTKEITQLTFNDIDTVQEYIQKRSPIYTGVEWRVQLIEKETREIVGLSKVILEGESCRFKECNFGNLIADAYVYMKSVQYTPGANKHWTDAAIGLVHGGEIQASIDAVSNGNGSITRAELETLFPSQHDLIVTQVTGAVLKKALEHSVSNYDKDAGNDEFLQVSGIHVQFDLDQKPGSRIEYVEVLCADCDIPTYDIVDDSKNYNIIISSFLKNGGDGFEMFKDAREVSKLMHNDIDTVEEYLIKRSPVYPAVEWRVQLRGFANIIQVSTTLVLVTVFMHLKNIFGL